MMASIIPDSRDLNCSFTSDNMDRPYQAKPLFFLRKRLFKGFCGMIKEVSIELPLLSNILYRSSLIQSFVS